MRGSLLQLAQRSSDRGIIPAHAGLTSVNRKLLPTKRDHPRACGAHEVAEGASVPDEGSSPRMRGSPTYLCARRCRDGIIPAHAGLTGWTQTTDDNSRDHPRACGAHPIGYRPERPRWGSSPRMRGSRLLPRGERRGRGIIPAHAGLTSSKDLPRNQSGDHPRACGAHASKSPNVEPCWGSSPRMRGSLPSRPMV